MKDLHRLTLEEKAGQLFVLGFQGQTLDRDTQALLDLIRPGGYILAQRNIDSFDQVYALTTRLSASSDPTPLIGIEQGAGSIDRFKQIFGALPALRDLKGGIAAEARHVARIIAAELESTGINLNFAPVVDLDVPGAVLRGETLSGDPVETGELAAMFVEELRRKGIVSCARHFPGMGAANRDPHFGLPRIDRPKRVLAEYDTLPFVQLLDHVDMIMVGHASYPDFGENPPLPASLSPRIVDGLLRKKMGFRGVIVTSDLTMGAITSIGLTPDRFLEAFEAGNDMILFSQTTPLAAKAFQTIVRAARASATLRARLDRSVERILAIKDRLVPSPLRYRPQMKARIARQIVKLRETREIVEAQELRPVQDVDVLLPR